VKLRDGPAAVSRMASTHEVDAQKYPFLKSLEVPLSADADEKAVGIFEATSQKTYQTPRQGSPSRVEAPCC